MLTIVLATSNRGKVSEIQSYFGEDPIQFVAQSEYGQGPIDETGTTFIENALLKAKAAAASSGLTALADDSGLVVPALGGRPGVRSARYAGSDASDADRYRLLLKEMSGLQGDERAAYFHCALAWLRYPNDPSPIIAQGQWHGFIAEEPSGDQGFGYDPVFYVPTEGCTSAELSQDKKNQLSHRGIAMQVFRTALLAATVVLS